MNSKILMGISVILWTIAGILSMCLLVVGKINIYEMLIVLACMMIVHNGYEINEIKNKIKELIKNDRNDTT